MRCPLCNSRRAQRDWFAGFSIRGWCPDCTQMFTAPHMRADGRPAIPDVAYIGGQGRFFPALEAMTQRVPAGVVVALATAAAMVAPRRRCA